MLEMDLKPAIAAIKKKNAKLVALQVPEGLKQRLAGIVSELENKSGAKVAAFVEPCFGACCLADEKAKRLGAELLLHFGHTRFLKQEAIETVYLPLEYEVDEILLENLLEKLVKELRKQGAKKVALCATVQYLEHLNLVEKFLKKKEIKAMNCGQVLGCNYAGLRNAKSDAIVFLGDGLFHALGISFSFNKAVFIVDLLGEEVKQLEKERDMFLRKRIAMISKAKQAEVFGILVSTVPGQRRMKKALELKGAVEKAGKKALVFAADYIDADALLGIRVDALVCTACPRIAFDDASSFKVPLLSPSELLIVLGKKGFDEYSLDELA